MKRLSTGVLTALLAAGFGFGAIVAPLASQAQGNIGNAVVAQAAMGSTPAANFGSPPSGQIPILYNDHHVYSKPDVLKRGRVLSALVRGGTVLIPLRSMFEQMGATVSYNASSKTVTVSKPGAEVKVTVGKPVVVINGESRPLDVAPIMYKGNVLVPVRVISEGMGAYVQWVPSQHLVVVRYLPPAPPSAPPTPEATAIPTVAPTPTPAPRLGPYMDHFIAGDYIFSPKVYNEFSPGNKGKSSYSFRGAAEFNALSLPWMLEGSYNQFQYPHNCTTIPGGYDPQCYVTTIGGLGSSVVPAFTVRDQDFDVRLGLKVANPHLYVGVGFLSRTGNYGYPRETGIGFGAEKLPDLNQALSFYGSAWYYPTVKGNFTDNTGHQYSLQYSILKYQLGLNYVLGSSPVFIDLGFIGENGKNKLNAPIGYTANGPYLGLGIKF